MKRLLVTGFEPFGGLDHNPSALVLEHLPDRIGEVAIEKAVLPVESEGVKPVLEKLHAEPYLAMLHLGLASEREFVTVERRAVNRLDFERHDNSGVLIRERPIFEGTPEEYGSRLPVERILAAWEEAEIAGGPSESAGTFLCNQVMYTSLHALPPHVPTGFIHLPPDEKLALGRPHQPISVQARAIEIVLRVIAALIVLLWVVPAEARPIRGMTVSCPRWGEIWGSPAMGQATKELASLGVEWIAIHPYGAIRRDGRVLFDEPTEVDYLVRSIDLSNGMSIFWTPHLAFWGTFEWRGAIEFDGEEERQRFFRDYEAFIVAHARFAEAKKIPLFSIGNELERMMKYEAEWRRIIASVRRVYRGKITYGANWDGIERVPFWDAVDLIGVQAYFPVAKDDAWTKIWERLGTLSKKHGGKQILFTEIGYPRSPKAALQPWMPDNDASAVALRERLLARAFAELDHPLLAGAFWWKWIPGNNAWDRDFSMRDDEAKRALNAAWKK